MTPQQLKTLIQSDPIAAELLLAGEDQKCAEQINVIAPPKRELVAAADLQYFAAIHGIWARLRLAIESGTTPDLIKGVCITFVDWVDAGRPIDLDHPQVATMLGALVQSGLVTAEQQTGLMALANRPQLVTALEIEFVRTRT
jgi:hypothetical protein